MGPWAHGLRPKKGPGASRPQGSAVGSQGRAREAAVPSFTVRMRGVRHWFALVHSLDEAHRLLVIKIPPVEFATLEDKADHAWRQATYRDDARGRFVPGLRVADSFMELLEPEDRATLGEDYLTGGHWLDFVEVPKSCFKPNYVSYEEHGERARSDLQRQVEAGWLEGPLHYRPRIVHAQAGIYAPEKDKFRPVVDARRSGLNDAIRPGECKYDMLDDVLEVLDKGDRHGAFDLVDAFYMWPTENRFCDYQGLQGPRCSPGLYRNRELGMGVNSSPGTQQRWARAIKKVVNREVLRPLSWRQLRAGIDGGAGCAAGAALRAAPVGRRISGLEVDDFAVEKAELEGLRRGGGGLPGDGGVYRQLAELAAMYVDDGKTRHPACFSAGQADAQFSAMLRFFDMYGLEYSEKKNVWPSQRGGYLGVELDTTQCEASVAAERAARYVRAIGALLEELRVRGDVGRRALASVTGKLIFASAVAPELRSMLAPCYWAQQAFVEAPGGGAEWAPWVRVRLDGVAVKALEDAARLLADPSRLRRRWYPHADPELAGFWRGRVRDTHEDMDATHRTSEGVVVITGDASGDQGAAVTVVRPEEGERRACGRKRRRAPHCGAADAHGGRAPMYFAAGRCSNAQCSFGAKHAGPCSHLLVTGQPRLRACVRRGEAAPLPPFCTVGATLKAIGWHAGAHKLFKCRVLAIRDAWPRVEYLEDEHGATHPLALPTPREAYVHAALVSCAGSERNGDRIVVRSEAEADDWMRRHHDAFIAQLAHAAAAPRECHAGRHSSCRSAQAISFCDWSVLSAVLSR